MSDRICRRVEVWLESPNVKLFNNVRIRDITSKNNYDGFEVTGLIHELSSHT